LKLSCYFVPYNKSFFAIINENYTYRIRTDMHR